MRQRQAQGQILPDRGRRLLQVRSGLLIIRQAIVRHADQDGRRCACCESGRRLIEQKGKFGDGFFQVSVLEQGETQVQAQAGRVGLHCQGLAVRRNGIFVMFVPHLERRERWA